MIPGIFIEAVRFANCDMLLHYHSGLAVGHTYTQCQVPLERTARQDIGAVEEESDVEEPETQVPIQEDGKMELLLGNRHDDDWDRSNDDDARIGVESESDVELFAATDE